MSDKPPCGRDLLRAFTRAGQEVGFGLRIKMRKKGYLKTPFSAPRRSCLFGKIAFDPSWEQQ